MGKVVIKFHFPKSNVNQVNHKLLPLYRRIMARFVMELRQKQPNVRLKNSEDFYAYELDAPTKFHYYVVNSKPYASYFETGTGIYGKSGKPIVPRHKKAYGVIIRVPYALHWQKGSEHFFYKSVKGMKPTKPFTRTVKEDFTRIFKEVMTGA